MEHTARRPLYTGSLRKEQKGALLPVGLSRRRSHDDDDAHFFMVYFFFSLTYRTEERGGGKEEEPALPEEKSP